jgi:hypothetical protein
LNRSALPEDAQGRREESVNGSKRKWAPGKVALFLAVFGLCGVLGSGTARADTIDTVTICLLSAAG